MDEKRATFGLRDCATDDEAASGNESDSLEEFSDSEDSYEEGSEGKKARVRSEEEGLLDRKLSWGAGQEKGEENEEEEEEEDSDGDEEKSSEGRVEDELVEEVVEEVARNVGTVRILEKPHGEGNSHRTRGSNGDVREPEHGGLHADRLDGGGAPAHGLVGVRRRRTQSWADISDGDEEEEDGIINGWGIGDQGLEEEEGDGNGGVRKTKADVTMKGSEPYDVPTSGAFYLHDDRCEEQPMRGRGRGRGRGFRLREPKWKHDKFEEMEKVIANDRRARNVLEHRRKPVRDMDFSNGGVEGSHYHRYQDRKLHHKSHARSISFSAGDEGTVSPSAEGSLPQGVSREELRVTRGGRRVSHHNRGNTRWSQATSQSPKQQTERFHEGGRFGSSHGGHQKRGSRGGFAPQQGRWDSNPRVNRASREESSHRSYHKRSLSVDDKWGSKHSRERDQRDWRKPATEHPPRAQRPLVNEKRGGKSRFGPGKPSDEHKSSVNVIEVPISKVRPAMRRPTHRRGFSEDNRARKPPSPTHMSPGFQLNPNAVPFQKINMNPNATPFVPPSAAAGGTSASSDATPQSLRCKDGSSSVPQNLPVNGSTT